ncbi:DUF5343 domain-containing protein [Sphingobium aromaticiconvertens]|uniref:DUF5343 domain-containing protein n=1 Tax=Sphingobium aromaticiconvertens TaxID=365341 RepID=UPI00301A3393
MALLNQPTQVYTQIPKFLETLRAGTAPANFNNQFLKDIGFKSSNHRAFIPLLKGLGFLTSDGTPTDRYKQFLDGSRWKQVLAEAVKEAYSDIFVIKAKPSSSDLSMVQGKFKSTYNLSDVSAERAAKTFLALAPLCDIDILHGPSKASTAASTSNATAESVEISTPKAEIESSPSHIHKQTRASPLGLHYNIQIHLPATKEVEVYNAIFKSIKEHLLD